MVFDLFDLVGVAESGERFVVVDGGGGESSNHCGFGVAAEERLEQVC